jgi:hypothetical protein
MKTALSLVVLAHFLVSYWHGNAHSTLGIQLPLAKNVFVYAVIVAAPIAAAILAWAGRLKIGLAIFAASMAGAFVFGAYHHSVLLSPDNVAHLPAGTAAAHGQFVDSAAVLAILELLAACWGFYALGRETAGVSPASAASSKP